MSLAIKERPILFSAPMVRALLDGRKTQTRRVVQYRHNGPKGDGKLHPPPDYVTRWAPNNGIGPEWHGEGPAPNGGMRGSGWTTCPYGKPGDRLWVRETFWNMTIRPRCYTGLAAGAGALDSKMSSMTHSMTAYRASGWGDKRPHGCSKWKPAIHMPRGLSRITLEITEVRVQRLQEISEEDAIAEGCEAYEVTQQDLDDMAISDADPQLKELARILGLGRFPACGKFQMLWNSINGAGSWDANPWVWALTFRRVQP